MILTALIVGLGASVQALSPRRLRHWFDFSPTWCVTGAIGTFVILAATAGATVVAAEHTANNLNQLQQIVVGSAGVGALRGGGDGSRGSALALGGVAKWFTWIDSWVQQHISDWAHRLTDDQLVAAVGRVKVSGSGGTTPAVIAKWFEQCFDLLSKDPASHLAARLDLENVVEFAYSAKLMRKRSA